MQVEQSENEVGNGRGEAGGRGKDEDPQKRDETLHSALKGATSLREGNMM